MAAEEEPPRSLLAGASIRASSVLERKKENAGKNAIDGDSDSAWTSDGKPPHWLLVKLAEPARPQSLALTFQGGFAGVEIEVKAGAVDEKPLPTLTTIFPADVNERQLFELPGATAQLLQFVIRRSSDLYGRVILYELDVLGSSASDDGVDSSAEEAGGGER
eukprot:PLAT4536.2.p1 GENE.PLAT4536.2~~PLAT4536.2.p1  ORF type:complete len:162 (-),score=51.17 PLAT4536.2:59-544(-)